MTTLPQDLQAKRSDSPPRHGVIVIAQALLRQAALFGEAESKKKLSEDERGFLNTYIRDCRHVASELDDIKQMLRSPAYEAWKKGDAAAKKNYFPGDAVASGHCLKRQNQQ